MNLQDKTPQELNMMVAEIIYPNLTSKPDKESDYIYLYNDKGEFVLNYNPICDDALAFRLMVENDITLYRVHLYGKWGASCLAIGGQRTIQCKWNEIPNRAIVETFILMNQHKEG